jgi:hypothetical protein
MNAVQQSWAHRYGIEPQQFRKLLRLVEHFGRMEDRASGNEGDTMNKVISDAVETAGKEIENYAKELGMTVDFDTGIFPRFHKNGHNEVIPHNDE